VKVKLDENLGLLGASFLRKHSIDVLTVADEGLLTAPDDRILGVCASEGRCLVTLDLDFSNPLQYRPGDYAGIVVVRIPGRLRLSELERALGLVVEASKVSDVRGRLWIAEVDRLREHLEESE
jgi:predicted nuclease of predicted toxin-antitoxin system